MEKCQLPGSPNWYLSQVLDCSWGNTVAYGSLTSIVLLNPSQSSNPVTVSHAHTSKVLSVSFAPHGFGNRLLTTSESGEAFVWNLDTYKVALAYRHSQKCALFGSWSHANGDLLVCVDEYGNLLQWNLSSNTITGKTFREHSFVVSSCCPHDQQLVAAGTKQGLVCVVNIKVPGKEFILHKLRGHDSEVVSLAWCPVRENIINLKIDGDCLLLASSAKERKIFFWRAGQDGLYEAFVETPLAPRVQSAVKQWNCISWYDPQQLLVSTIGGEVLVTNVSKLKAKKGSEKGYKWSTFSDCHNRCHVVVKCSPWWVANGVGSIEDWRQKAVSSTWVWTFGADRIVTGICSDKQVSPIKINTIGGPVHAMSISPIDGASLAIGVADKSIRVVNTNEPQLKTMQTFTQKVSGKVMSLSWHPSKDGWLAYGTSDGRIGIHFTCTIRQPLLFRPFSKESIYAMEWGPSLSLIKSSFETQESEEIESDSRFSKYVLYAVGGGQIAAMDPNKPDEFFYEPFKTVLKTALKPESLKNKNKTLGLTDLAWKPDFSVLALGDESGSIHLLNMTQKEDLLLVASLKLHSSLIQDLSWHPQCCSSDATDISPQANWLASASNDNNIQVLDVTSVLETIKDCSTDTTFPLLNIPCIATLKGHKLRVSKVTWSPHESGRLLSVSYDQCAQVWDVINCQPVACYTLHNAPLFCCVWSPFSPSLVITAGHEGLIRIWDIQEQQAKLPVLKTKDGNHLHKEAKEAKSLHGDSSGISVESPKSKEKKREKAVLPLSGPSLHKDESNIEILKYLLHPSEVESVKFEGEERGDDGKTLPLHYAFFANQATVEQYLMKESKSNVTEDVSFTLSMWKGSPKDAITKAIESKTLTSFMVSIAPTVSHKIWVDACAAYAEQLQSLSEHSKASAYLLAIHKVEDAVKLLAGNGKFRHALAIARCRLPADSPLIRSLLLDWAQECISQGQQSLAALCFGSAGEWTKAAQCLAVKKTCSRLMLAAQIMKEKCESPQSGMFYVHECFNQALSQSDWLTAKSALNLYPSLNHLALRLFIHETIYSNMHALSVADWIIINNLEIEQETETDTMNISICFSKDKVMALKKDLVNEVAVNNDETAWLAISRKVTLAYLAAPKHFPKIMSKFVLEESNDNQQEAYRHLVQLMSLLYHYHITYKMSEDSVPLFLRLCMWLAPQGPSCTSSLFSSSAEPLQSSLRAFLAAGILLWLLQSKVSDENVCASAVSLIYSLKSDIFSPESLKSFKVDFKLKILQDKKLNQTSKKEVTVLDKLIEPQAESCDPADVLHSLSLSDTASQANPTDEVSVCDSTKGETKPMHVDEMEELWNWVRNFKERREQVPNPYLSYSNLVQILTALKSSSDFSSYQENFTKFWEETNHALDI